MEKRTTELLKEGKYLAALASVEQELANAVGEQKAFPAQMRAAIFSFCGDETSALEAFSESDKAQGRPTPKTQIMPQKARIEDAKKSILHEARTRQIVILNEAHHVPRHRVFGLSLLLDLRKQGFTHFAAETLAPPDALARSLASGAITREAGYYLHDPVFASYLREAQRLGFIIVPYEEESKKRVESPIDQINNREIEQTQNLHERIFKASPKARVFIHVGYAHADKTEGDDLTWMAARLKKLLGVDPLTIDQTGGMEYNGWETGKLRTPSVVRQPDNTWLSSGGIACDMSVFHPKLSLRQWRSQYLFGLPGRRPVMIPRALLPTKDTGRVLIQAFADGEPIGAIARDQMIVQSDTPVPVLVLTKGRYRVLAQSETGEVIGEIRVVV
jgi:hypothetical protein